MQTRLAASPAYTPVSPSVAFAGDTLGQMTFMPCVGKARWGRRPGLLRRVLSHVLVCVRSNPECRAESNARRAAEQAHFAGGRLLRTLLDPQRSAAGGDVLDRDAKRFLSRLDALAPYRDADQARTAILAALLKPASTVQLCRLKANLMAAESNPAPSVHGMAASYCSKFLLLACLRARVEMEIAQRVTGETLLDLAKQFDAASTERSAQCLARLADSLAMFGSDREGKLYLIRHGMSALPPEALRLLSRGLSDRQPLPGADSPLQRIAAEFCALAAGDTSRSRHVELIEIVEQALAQSINLRIDARLADVEDVLRVGCRTPARVERSLEEAWGICLDVTQAVGADLSGPRAHTHMHAAALMLKAFVHIGAPAIIAYVPRSDVALIEGMSACLSQLGDQERNDMALALENEQAARHAARRQHDYANLALALDALTRAVQANDRNAIAKGLATLLPFQDALSRSASRTSGVSLSVRPGTSSPESDDDALHLRAQSIVGASVSILRSPGEEQDALSPASLRLLSNAAIADLRRATASGLQGISIKDENLEAELESRGRSVATHLQNSLQDAIHALAEKPLQPQRLVYALAAASRAALQQMKLLAELGNEVVGGDGLAEYAVAQVERAVTGIDDTDVLTSSAASVPTHAMVLQQALQLGRAQIARADDEADIGAADPLTYALNMLGVASMLLHALSTRLDPVIEDLPSGADDDDLAGQLGPQALAALSSAFGIRLQTSQQTLAPLVLNRRQAAVLYGALTIMPTAETARPMTVALALSGGASSDIQVDTQFYRDAIQRTSVSFSVRGKEPGGTVTGYSPMRQGPAGAQHDSALNDALLAMHGLAGEQALTLTRIMNQQLAGGLVTALAELGAASPILLADGSSFLPGGAARLHFDVQKQDDDGYHIGASIRFTDMDSGTRLVHSTGEAQAMALASTLSHFNAEFSLSMSADGLSMRMATPIMFDYCVTEQ
jgi:hypothetical protein